MLLIEEMRKKIAEAEAKIAELQECCPHPEPAIVVKSVGTDSAGDQFRNCICGLCNKSFTRGMPE